VPLSLGHLDPEDPLQPASEGRRDPDALVESLDISFELGGRDVAALRAPGVPPDTAEVAEAALRERVVELRSALGADQRALQVVVVLPTALPPVECASRTRCTLSNSSREIRGWWMPSCSAPFHRTMPAYTVRARIADVVTVRRRYCNPASTLAELETPSSAAWTMRKMTTAAAAAKAIRNSG
jgi:hypothetical protein